MESDAELQRKANPEERVVFATGDSVHVAEADVPKYLILGVSRDAYRFMAAGRTHTFDLRYLGLPTQLIMFGGKSHAHILDSMSLFTGGPKIADMHTEHPVAEDESMLPKMRKAARAWSVMRGAHQWQPLKEATDAELDTLFAAILQQEITPGDLRSV